MSSSLLSFKLLFYKYLCAYIIYTCRYISKYIATIYLLCTKLLYICFQGWSCGIGQSTDVLLPGEDYFSCALHFWVTCSSLYRVEASWIFSVHFSMSFAVLAQLMPRQIWLWEVMDITSDISRKHYLLTNSWATWLLHSLCPSSTVNRKAFPFKLFENIAVISQQKL